ncbi:hypothetical protein [Candidatus Villigracilis affinis]|uniref:hypothetical protein n=1 Tax=Candidatus Villigracilis affinis TaxID=3140682 RepID=UPI002A1D102D|nr:hypothetical protein [Anaerolineales bacterium]
MNNLEGDLRNLLNSYSQKDLLGPEQILEFSFMLMAHPSPDPWVDKFISKRYPEDLISLILSLSIPTANFLKQLQVLICPNGRRNKFQLTLQPPPGNLQ